MLKTIKVKHNELTEQPNIKVTVCKCQLMDAMLATICLTHLVRPQGNNILHSLPLKISDTVAEAKTKLRGQTLCL